MPKNKTRKYYPCLRHLVEQRNVLYGSRQPKRRGEERRQFQAAFKHSAPLLLYGKLPNSRGSCRGKTKHTVQRKTTDSLWLAFNTQRKKSVTVRTCVRGRIAGSDELHPVELHPGLVGRPPETALLRELTQERHHPLGAVLVLRSMQYTHPRGQTISWVSCWSDVWRCLEDFREREPLLWHILLRYDICYNENKKQRGSATVYRRVYAPVLAG